MRPRQLSAVIVVPLVLVACGGRADVAAPLDPTAGPLSAASPAVASTASPGAQASSDEDGAGGTGGDRSSEPEQAEGREVLSSCPAVADSTTSTLVDDTGPRPEPAVIDAALAERPDLQEYVHVLEAEGASSADARHHAYAQVIANEVFDAYTRLPGYVSGAIALPIEGKPFEIAFSGEVPDGFAPSPAVFGSYGLVVTTGAAGLDEAFLEEVFRAAQAVDLVVKEVVDDPTTGTVDLEVVEGTPEQVAALEDALDEPDRVCVVRVPPDFPCDEVVVAAANEEAQRQGEVVSGAPATSEEADVIRRSHLGLPLDESEAKAAEEGRAWRIVARDGVGFFVTADGAPGRISVTACLGTVVDASVERAFE